jgi:hypothetical protein
VPVFVDQKAHQSLKEVAAGLANYAAIQPVQTEADARLIIDRNKDTISIKSGDLELLVAPVSMGDKGYVQRVLDQVKDIVHWLIVMDLQSPGQAIDIGFEMALEDDESATRNVSQVAPGTRLIYRVRNRDDMPLFVYVLDVSSDGSITLLYPKVGGAQEALPAGEALEQTIETFLPQGQTSVTDVLKVIATKRPIDPSVFPQGSLRNAAPPPATRGRADLLAEFLAQRMRGKTRGMKQVEVTSWVTRQHAIKIR